MHLTCKLWSSAHVDYQVNCVLQKPPTHKAVSTASSCMSYLANTKKKLHTSPRCELSDDGEEYSWSSLLRFAIYYFLYRVCARRRSACPRCRMNEKMLLRDGYGCIDGGAKQYIFYPPIFTHTPSLSDYKQSRVHFYN